MPITLIILVSGCTNYLETKEQCLATDSTQIKYCECLGSVSDGQWDIWAEQFEYCEEFWIDEDTPQKYVEGEVWSINQKELAYNLQEGKE